MPRISLVRDSRPECPDGVFVVLHNDPDPLGVEPTEDPGELLRYWRIANVEVFDEQEGTVLALPCYPNEAGMRVFLTLLLGPLFDLLLRETSLVEKWRVYVSHKDCAHARDVLRFTRRAAMDGELVSVGT
jgi:hypothetical protein